MDVVKKLVSGRLRAQEAGRHPDPDLLAAFAEKGLSQEARNGLLNHLAKCMECRDTLYLAMPEPDTQQVLLPSREPRLAMRWATVAVSVVILGSVLVVNRAVFSRHVTSSYSPAREKSQPKREIAELKTPPEVDQIAPASAKMADAKVLPPVKHMTAKPKASMQFDQSGEVRLGAAQSASRGDEALATGAKLAKNDLSRVSWGLSANGDVQRSLDSGKTWQIVPVSKDASFRAISSVGDDIWVGGTAGILYHSADSGQSWQKTGPALIDEIVHIDFSDPQNGVLSTANGQVWNTSDGGQNWRLK